ncbi:restriction endonuclease subunit S [Psittacicella gerlachiana]|uniref:restriction endonuclease subunit S n=1 Tax=Psittacicella gerlachiana TaxID=2028574 RepID=UPI000E6A8823|nr:restriction endonuclease subunit S [Psittacicella gerlachiana]
MKSPKLRFKDFNDKWENNKLEVFLIKNSERNKDLKINFIESVSNKFGFISQSELFSDRKMYGKDLSKYIVVHPTYFAYNPMALSSGSIAYKEFNESISIVSPDYVSFTTNDLLSRSFLWYWIHTKNFENQRIVLTSGGVRSRLYFESLVQMQINVPSLEEQNYIGAF